MQDPSTILNIQHWRSTPEDYFNIITFILICIDQACYRFYIHRIIGGLLAILSCRSLLYTIARNPDIAIFVEMVDSIKKSMFTLIISYASLFIGWIVAFHVLLGKIFHFHDLSRL